MISGKISKHVHYKFFPWNASTASLIASRNVSFDCPGASGICVFNCIHKSPGQVWISMFKFREMLNHTSRNNPYRNSPGSYHRWQNRLRNFSERRRAFLSFVFRVSFLMEAQREKQYLRIFSDISFLRISRKLL